MRCFHTDREVFVLHYAAGESTASELCAALEAIDVPISEGGTKEAFVSRWQDAGAFIFVGALAIAVRSISDLITDKALDPAVVVVSEDGGIALPVIAGHIGLATDLARECAEILSARGALYVPTTSSDRAGFTAPDLWASRRGYHILLRSKLAGVISKFRETGEIAAWLDPIMAEHGVELPLPFGYCVVGEQSDADIVISPRAIQKLVDAKPQIVPKVVTLGIGSRAGAKAETIETVTKGALSKNFHGPFLMEAVAELRTVEAKLAERGLLEFAESHSLKMVVVSDAEILSMDDKFSPSAASRHIGLPGAAEPAAASAGSLLGERVAEMGVTVAISLSKPPEVGELAIVGTGPGDARFITAESRAAIDASEVIIGYGSYIELLPASWKRGKIVESFGMGEEEDRVARAFSYVESGYRVVLVSGGDATVFGMASLSLSMAPASIGADKVRVIPGITALQAAGAAMGAPYSNGFAVISLSDYLQSWHDVVRALEGACESGLAVAIYNPVAKGLSEKLEEVRRIFSSRRAVVVRNAGRQGEILEEMPVAEITPEKVDMRSVIFVLSPNAVERDLGGKKIWIEVRGYESEKTALRKPEALGQFLVLGGTSEGREAAAALLERGFSVTVSVTREAGAATVPKGAGMIVGARDWRDWSDMLDDPVSKGSTLGVVDATHPFAEDASREITSACEAVGIPLCRYLRKEEFPEDAVTAADLNEAVERAIEMTFMGDVIFLAIGTNDLKAVMPRIREFQRGVLVRMLPMVESIRLAERAGLQPKEIIASWGAGNADFNEALCRDRGVRVMVSRDSGVQGGVAEKAEAARRLGIPLVLVSRPEEISGVVRAYNAGDLLRWCEGLSSAKGRKNQDLGAPPQTPAGSLLPAPSIGGEGAEP
ncbi:MAG: precorrin-6A reductase [Synergistaceae bacterium]|jgi:cobalt-precorrin 5A hydrolase/precorrin-3B C17-methyltransferase|nr:precorrin-6A reductase [Synergistaceae bacterium]